MTLGSIIAPITSLSILFTARLVGAGLAFGVYLVYDMKLRKARSELSRSQSERDMVMSEIRDLEKERDKLWRERRAVEQWLADAEQQREEAEAAIQSTEERRAAFARIRI